MVYLICYLSISLPSLPRLYYAVEDREWFLKLANSQHNWQSKDNLLNESVVSSSYSGDLVTAVEQSWRKHKPSVSVNLPPGCVTLPIYKLYLGRILKSYNEAENESNKNGSGPLLMYSAEVWYIVTTPIMTTPHCNRLVFS